MSDLHPNFENIQINKNYKVAVVSTLWNQEINKKMLEGASSVFQQYPSVSVYQYQVPGAVELTHAARILSPEYNAIIVLGAVIKGDTAHFESVCQSVTQGITQLNASQPTPIIMGVLMVYTEVQAAERLGGIHGHKGKEAAYTALHMLMFDTESSSS